MSLCVGSSASAWARGGQVSGVDLTGCAGGVGSGSLVGSAGAGRVCAQDGAGFCMGTADFGWDSSSIGACSSGAGSACAQEGARFCIGRAGLGSASTVASIASVPMADWVCSGSSGSVSGSKAGVTKGSSGSMPSSLGKA